MNGITAYSSYIPFHFLELADVGALLGSGGDRGVRSVASYDEDPTTMAVEAARRLPAIPRRASLFYASSSPPYHDKTNATAAHAALGMDVESHVVDLMGSVRGGISALLLAAGQGGVAMVADTRIGLPGSRDEAYGGDGAAAFTFGDDQPLAEFLTHASRTREFLDRWRIPGQNTSRVWEERFGAQVYEPLMKEVAGAALTQAGIDAPDHIIVSSSHARAARTIGRAFGDALHTSTAGTVGFCGAADAALQLASVLDRAAPGETILLVSGADGADALVLRVTAAIEGHRAATSVDQQVAARRQVPYPLYLTWRDQLHREPPRRPDPTPFAAPPAAREADWKYRLVGSRCAACSKVHLPPQRVCMACNAVDQMEDHSLADVPGRVATFTIDRLAFSPSPPTVAVVVDFEGGGRFECEMTDEDPDTVRVGDQVEMTFRKRYTAAGVHNYFWKAAPRRSEAAGE
jgi:hydroxymethylglutaryl-CoA synthase